MNAPRIPFFSAGAEPWLRLISFGIRPGMPFPERKRYLILSSAALIFAVGSGFFAAANFLQGNFHLLPYNLCSFACATAALCLLARGRFHAALGVSGVAVVGVSFVTGYLYHNGLEIDLLVYIVVVIFLVDSIPWRVALVALSCIGYMVVQASHYDFFRNAGVDRTRYLVTIAIGLGTTSLYMAIFRAISDSYQRTVERQNAELEAERAALRRANEAKERLFSLIAHDLLSPVNHLKEALAHLDAGRLSPEGFQPLRERLRHDVDEVHGFLSNLLAWSVGQTEAIVPRPVAVSLATQADEAVRLLDGVARRKGLAVSCSVPAGAVARADADQTAAVFRNLLSNAIKFTPSGGRIAIEARPAPGAWQVTVRDDGVGMDPAKARRLFGGGEGGVLSTPGTANEKGLGLGLRICREFVLANGGAIWAESAFDRGSAFHFTLPAGPGSGA